MSEGNQGQSPDNPQTTGSENLSGQTTPSPEVSRVETSDTGFIPVRRQPTEAQSTPIRSQPRSFEDTLRMLAEAKKPEGFENWTPEMMLQRMVREQVKAQVDADLAAQGLLTPGEDKVWQESMKQNPASDEISPSPGTPVSSHAADVRNTSLTDALIRANPEMASALDLRTIAQTQETNRARAEGRPPRDISSFDRDINEVSPATRARILAAVNAQIDRESQSSQLTEEEKELLRQPLVAEALRSITTSDPPREDDEYERITVQMGFGPTEVEWPKSTQGKLHRVRRVMNLLEDFEEGQEAPGLGPLYREVEAVVSSLTTSPDSIRREQGTIIRTEEKARIALHTGYMGFKLADSMDNVRDALKNSIWSPHLGWALKQKLIIEALQFLENNAKGEGGYIDSTHMADDKKNDKNPPQKLKEFKVRAEDYLKKKSEEGDIGAEAAYRIAERIFLFSGRAAMHDHIYIKVDSKGDKTWDFWGDFKGGGFQMRRLLRMNEWMYTQYGDHWFPELMFGVDLETPDWFEFFRQGPFAKYQVEDRDFYKLPEGVSEKSVPIHGEDDHHRELDGQIVQDMRLIDYSATNWQELNVTDVGERPLDFWSYRKLAQPDGARKELTKIHGLLKDPKAENLFKGEVADLLSFLGARHWTNNERLLNNLLDFLRHSNWKKLRRANISFEEKDSIIQQAVQHHVIEADQLSRVEKKQLGWWKIPSRILNIFNIFKFLFGTWAKMLEDAVKFSV